MSLKYGELIVQGPNGDEDRTKSRFALCQRSEGNSVKPYETFDKLDPAYALMMRLTYTITFERAQEMVREEYGRDKHTDMFQIGRSTERQIDFAVTHTVPVAAGESNISRFACRITCQRSPPHTAHIYAGGFDSSNNIFLSENSTVQWSSPNGQMDALTTNGVLVKRPHGPWREISVRGHTFTPREPRADDNRGIMVDGYKPHELVDGSLIDLCGVTLLWRTAEGLAKVF